MKEDDEEVEKYCSDCGGDNLAHKENYACGAHYICRDCGKENCFAHADQPLKIQTVTINLEKL